MDSLPARDGAAAKLASLMHERGLTARIRSAGSALVLTIRNPAVPEAGLTQKIAFVPGKDGSEGLFLCGSPWTDSATWPSGDGILLREGLHWQKLLSAPASRSRGTTLGLLPDPSGHSPD